MAPRNAGNFKSSSDRPSSTWHPVASEATVGARLYGWLPRPLWVAAAAAVQRRLRMGMQRCLPRTGLQRCLPHPNPGNKHGGGTTGRSLHISQYLKGNVSCWRHRWQTSQARFCSATTAADGDALMPAMDGDSNDARPRGNMPGGSTTGGRRECHNTWKAGTHLGVAASRLRKHGSAGPAPTQSATHTRL